MSIADVSRDLDFPALGRSLAEAEETIEAIRRGSVDAVVVQGPDGPQVVLLHGADEPYRVLVERMSDGAVTLAPDGTILYSNGRLDHMIGVSPNGLIGHPFAALFAEPPPLPADGLPGEGQLLREQGPPLPVSFRMQPLAIGATEATLVTLTDLSVLRRAEATAAAERFARSILEQATDAILVLGPDARITHASLIAEQLAVSPPIGRLFSDAFPLEGAEGPDGRLGRLPAEGLDRLLATKPFHGLEVKLRDRRFARRTFLLSTGPLLNDEGRAVGSIVTLTDITERKRAEEQQTVLVAELNHRVKNILAIVQSVAAQTVRSAGSLDAFSNTFAGRLSALSLAHDILTKTRWIGIGLSELLASVLAPYRSAEDRISMHGPSVLLSARTVLPLSMTLHELTTNAAKYGALSRPEGHVDVSWRVSEGEDERIELVWQEQGGPEVERRAKPGFGTRLIERVVAYDLEGTSTLDFAPAGLRCTVAFPVNVDPVLPMESRVPALS